MIKKIRHSRKNGDPACTLNSHSPIGVGDRLRGNDSWN